MTSPESEKSETGGITRRTVLVASAGAAVSGMIAGAKVIEAATAPGGNPAGLKLLSSVDDVIVPPKAAGLMKFSFPWPEPSLEFGGLLFAFEVLSYENRYAIDPSSMRTEPQLNGLKLTATRLTWAGGQETTAAVLEVVLNRTSTGAVEWIASANASFSIKAIKTVVRGLPRGRVSAAAEQWRELGDDEKVFEYPALMGGMATPLIAIQGTDGRIWGVSSLQRQIRPARFMLWPGAQGYKLELVSEMAGWDRSTKGSTARWRIMSAENFAGVARAHFEHVGEAWQLPGFTQRSDAPEWMKHIALVLSLHGQHWSGRIFNSYERQLEILRWAAKRIDPRHVLVFLAGWDGRYYWDYPAFQCDPRMGGEAKFQRLIEEGHRLGFRFLLMFGSNTANPKSPLFPKLADAQLRDTYGEIFPANYVDWDGDWKGDASMVFMNLAVPSWREHLRDRISDMIARFKVDSYFLDIAGLWENNTQGDIDQGMRRLVAELAQRHPGIPPVAEMQYDAQMGYIPMSHVPRYALAPEHNFNTVASFNHLSYPSPGDGASGVHEWGFGRYVPVTREQLQIPTITFSDSTFEKHADLAAKDIATAVARFEARGRKT